MIKSRNQYIVVDMILLTLLTCLLEWAGRIALDVFPGELFTISLVLPMTLIAMMRHGTLGVLVAALGGLTYCILNSAAWDVYLIYILGNSMIAVNLVWFGKPGKERIRQSPGMIVMYVLSGYLLMNLGRSLLAFVMGYTPFLATTVRYFTTDTLSAVMAVIIVLIARKQDGVFEDQMRYLERLASEKEQGNGNEA